VVLTEDFLSNSDSIWFDDVVSVCYKILILVVFSGENEIDVVTFISAPTTRSRDLAPPSFHPATPGKSPPHSVPSCNSATLQMY